MKTAFVFCKTTLSIFLLLSMISGCLKQNPAPEPVSTEPEIYVHTIRYSGETLGRIAAWYLGSAGSWEVLQEYNTGLKPTRLKIGQEILIPQDRMKRFEPLPKPAASKKSVVSEQSEKLLPPQGKSSKAEAETVVKSGEETFAVETPQRDMPKDQAVEFVEEAEAKVGLDQISVNAGVVETEGVASESKELVEPKPIVGEGEAVPEESHDSEDLMAENSLGELKVDPAPELTPSQGELSAGTDEQEVAEDLSREELWDKLLRVK